MDPSAENFELAIIPDWHKKVNSFFSEITWAVMAFLIVPTILIIFVQNSVPGDSTYFIKTGLESAFLAIVKLFNKQAAFQIDYTERRYQEAIKVLASKYGVKSMDALFEQIVTTEDSIKNVDNPEERRQLAGRYINTLLEVNSGLENKKMEIVTAPVKNISSYAVTNTPIPAANYTFAPTNTPTPQPQNNATSEISDKIDNTQKKIEETIKEMENQQTLLQAPVPSATPSIATPQPTATSIPVEIYNRAGVEPTSVNNPLMNSASEPTIAVTTTPIPTAVPTAAPTTAPGKIKLKML